MGEALSDLERILTSCGYTVEHLTGTQSVCIYDGDKLLGVLFDGKVTAR